MCCSYNNHDVYLKISFQLNINLLSVAECSDEMPCQGLGEHAHFSNFGMAFLTLFRVATGDNWNGIMKDTLRDNCDDTEDCIRNCCVSSIIAPIFFVIFVLMAQFVLVNVVVAVLMKHLEESHKQVRIRSYIQFFYLIINNKHFRVNIRKSSNGCSLQVQNVIVVILILVIL